MKKIERKTHQLDALGQSFGRLATQTALLLQGKNKPCFVRNQDIGDAVKIINLEKITFTGKKFEQKKYSHHTGYIGSIKTKKLSELFPKNPEKVFTDAVFDMLPKNKLRKSMIKRLSFIKNN